MGYEKRLTCFIDVLGFKNAIKKTECDSEFFKKLHSILDNLNPDLVLETQQSLAFGKFGYPASSSIVDDASFLETNPSDFFPLKITQFSDSFVISCAADNPYSCFLLLSIASKIVTDFFWSLGLLVRGGIVLGELIHDCQRIVFGPAMNEAHELESKYAIYPRVIMSNEAYKILSESFGEREEFSTIEQSFDGYKIIDLISILMSPHSLIDEEKILQQLNLIENEITRLSRQAHPKIAYLISRFNQRRQ